MVTDGVLAGLGISSSGVDRIWRVVGPTMQGDGCGRVKFQAPLPREAQKFWHYLHPFCIENTCRHPYTLEWRFTARSTCFFKIAISGQSFSISRESMKQKSCKLLATMVSVCAKPAQELLLIVEGISLIFEWSGPVLLGPFLAMPLGSGKFTSHEIYQAI